MRLTFDRQADAISLKLKEGKLRGSKEVAPGIFLHYDHNGDVATIEVLAASHYAGRPLLDHLEMDLAPPYEPLEIEVDLLNRKGGS
ncbi:MAG: hypothetical protein HW403_1023 [Dehalococcoidia bacterium]|nr:hypothetical protein [Dehalococcoidia bacterium]